MSKILCIGEALIDMICTDKDAPLTHGENFVKKAGGAPTNVAAAIAALGGEVSIAAKIGIDPFGQHLIEVMKQFGVNTQWMLQDKNHFTTFAFVSLLSNGERDFYFNRGADGQLSVKDLEGLSLTDFNIVHFGSATGFLPGPLQSTYIHLLEKALQQNLLVSFDPNYRHLLFQHNTKTFIEQSWYFLTRCHFFKLSDEEALLLTEKNNLQEAAEHLLQTTKAVFAITLGEAGTWLRINNQLITIPSIPIKPVDTTGAGDAFVGAVLYQLSQHHPAAIQQLSNAQWQAIIANANKAGARTCEYLGAMDALKHLNHQIFN
jgi:fructokinase